MQKLLLLCFMVLAAGIFQQAQAMAESKKNKLNFVLYEVDYNHTKSADGMMTVWAANIYTTKQELFGWMSGFCIYGTVPGLKPAFEQCSATVYDTSSSKQGALVATGPYYSGENQEWALIGTGKYLGYHGVLTNGADGPIAHSYILDISISK